MIDSYRALGFNVNSSAELPFFQVVHGPCCWRELNEIPTNNEAISRLKTRGFL